MRPASCPRIFCHRALLSHPLIPLPLLPRSYAYLLQYLPCFPPPPCFLATRAWMAPRPPPFRLFFTTPPPLLVPSTEKPSYFKAENIPKSLFCKKKYKNFPYSVSLFAICSSSLPTSPNYRLLKSVGSGRGLTPRARWEGRVIQSSSDQSGWGKPLLPSPFLFFSPPLSSFSTYGGIALLFVAREGELSSILAAATIAGEICEVEVAGGRLLEPSTLLGKRKTKQAAHTIHVAARALYSAQTRMYTHTHILQDLAGSGRGEGKAMIESGFSGGDCSLRPWRCATPNSEKRALSPLL